MHSKVVTVFGGSGFIGRYVVQRLAELGAVVRVPTRRPERALFLKPLGAIGQIVLEPWNPSATGEVERLLAGSDQAVSLIGILFEGRGGDFDRLQARLPGEIGAAAARQRARARGPRLGDRRRAGSPAAYARTKAAGEAALGRLPAGDDPAPEHRVRARGRLLQPLRADEPVLAGLCR